MYGLSERCCDKGRLKVSVWRVGNVYNVINQVGQLNIPVYIIGWTMKGGGEGRVGDMPTSGAVATD